MPRLQPLRLLLRLVQGLVQVLVGRQLLLLLLLLLVVVVQVVVAVVVPSRSSCWPV